MDTDALWLQWDKFSNYRKFRSFVQNPPVINDIAEQGMKMIQDFIGKIDDGDELQSLLLVFRNVS